MTPHEFYSRLAYLDLPRSVTLSPGPFTIKVDYHDAIAAKLLLWLEDYMPDSATLDDLHEVLHSAQWWATFWAGAQNASST